MKTFLGVVAALALAGAVQAQTGPAPKIENTEGVVTALSDSQITLAEAGGKAETIKLLPTWSVIVSTPITVDQIKPGSYLGTTNHANADGTGAATEVHVSPPGQTGPGLDFLMDGPDHTTMTNGVVATVVKSDGGQVLEINYGAGARKVTVPPGTPIVLNAPGDRAAVKPGLKVRVATFTVAGGTPRQIVIIAPNGSAPG